jgi:hypothetical protein
MPRQLKSPQHQQRNQRTYMQTIGGGVETAIERARPTFQPLDQGIFPRHLEDQTAGAEISYQCTAHGFALFCYIGEFCAPTIPDIGIIS